MSHRLRTRGFTLVELLVVIAIIGILVALLLPAIQAARQAALKNSCRNNVKQLGLALQNHNDTYKTFPPLFFTSKTGTSDGSDKGTLDPDKANNNQYNWIIRLLPFIEEENLYKSISANSKKFTVVASGVTVPNPSGSGTSNMNLIKLNPLLCPSFSGDQEDTSSRTASNYMALSATTNPKLVGNQSGSMPNLSFGTPQPDGMIIPDKLARGQSMARMSDGTSKTAVLCESKEGAVVSGVTQTYFNNWCNPRQTYVVGFAPGQSGVGKSAPSFNSSGVWSPLAPDISALNYGPTPSDTAPKYNGSTRTFGPSSDHMGGIIVHAMGDGSVQELTDTGTDAKVYFAAITARGGENVGSPGGNN
jgi:prepilin-type N-terminal cleavage/methylation domain-containing protein